MALGEAEALAETVALGEAVVPGVVPGAGSDGVPLGVTAVAGQVWDRLNHCTSPPLTSAVAEVSLAPGADPT